MKLPLSSLEAEVTKEMELNLLSSLDTLKVKDKKDRGTITLKVDFPLDIYIFFSFLLFPEMAFCLKFVEGTLS